jgi:hypothetical protein
MRRTFLFGLAVLIAATAFAQGPAHFVQGHANAFIDKQLFMAGYAIGWRKVNISVCAGTGKGTDEQYISPENSENQVMLGNMSSSTTVEPVNEPANSYVERCSSTYETKMVRLGFTVFFRNNDTLGRRAFTGPHLGVEGIYMRTLERQEVIYKSKSDESRYMFSGGSLFDGIGAASHAGWQFALLNERLYIDLRAGITFYYPFMDEPNLNSPFVGNRWEGQLTVSWRFGGREKTEDVEDATGGKVREKI